ncbi:MAG: ABC transporter ATP-binding protein [Spirochaetia bacterium]|nr:ABC transporter ATP-binding protein [Spirochaetia bacterium]
MKKFFTLFHILNFKNSSSLKQSSRTGEKNQKQAEFGDISQSRKQDKIVKSYDPVIMKRLLTFTKPYKFQVIIAVIALFFATSAELIMPVIMQKTIDEKILVTYSRVENIEENEEIIDKIDKKKTVVELSGYVYFSDKSQGLPADYFITEFSDNSELLDLIQENQTTITVSGEYLIIKIEDLNKLTIKERRLLRESDISSVKSRGLIYLGLLIGGLLFTFLQVYLMAYTGQKVMEDIRLKLYNHTVRQSLNFLGKTPVGGLVTKITNDVETINEFFTSVATSVLKDFSLVAGVLITLFYLDYRLALITVLSIPPVFIATFFFRIIARNAYRSVREAVSNVNTFLSEHISGMDIVQMFGREAASKKEFGERNKKLLKANLSEMYVFAVFRPLMNLFTAVSISVIIYFGAGNLLKHALSLGVLIAFIDLIQKFYRPIMDFAEKFTILQSAMAGGERIFSLMDDIDQIEDNGIETLQIPVKGQIEFKDVSFAYKENEPVLKNLSFKVNPGEKVAIVGYTGAGKTTIANLITRLWDINSGAIFLDGIDIRDLKLKNLRETVIPVQQDVFLFSGTIEESIKTGLNISDREIKKAAELAQANGFIKKMEKGYKTILNERGSNLSTGQRQLLSFARVIAQNPQVIILDEATGNVDTETEKLIQKAIEELMKERTSLVIAHRLSTIRTADKILVLSKGHLEEMGTHEELLKLKGIYYNLYKLQYESQGSRK